ncbi:MAG: choice-of-anchor L domain-containing protein, partial [Chitinophagales bacterium]
MKNFTISVLSFLVFSILFKSSLAQLVVTSSIDPDLLAQKLVGGGVTVSNATIITVGDAAGYFSQTNTNIGIDSGILLTSGSVNNAPGPNTLASTTTDNNANGDAQLDALIVPYLSQDATILEFDVEVSGDSLKFNYVFASEEYNDFVNTGFNDVFAFFISGPGIIGSQNIALVPGTATPVTINNVNCGSYGQYYICNDPWDPFGGGCNNECPPNANGTTIEYDGFTVVLQAIAAVQPCEVYHLKLAIADAGDGAYDSGVFLEAGSLTSSGTSVQVVTSYIDPNTSAPAIVEGCFDGSFHFVITNAPIDTSFIHYTVGGSATNGVDYTEIPDSLQINPGDTTVDLTIHSLSDGISEGSESITLYLFLPCSPIPYDSATILILDTLIARAEPDTTICIGNSVQLSANGADGWLWNPAAGLSCTDCQNPLATPVTTTTYTLTITVGGCNASDEVTIIVDNPLPVIVVPDSPSVCLGDSIQLNALNAGSFSWSPATGLSCTNCASPFASPAATTTYIVTGNNSCFTSFDTITVTVNPAVSASAFGSITVCPGDTVQLSASGGETYSWSPEIGLDDPLSQNPLAVVTGNVTYTVLVSNQFGCTDTASVTVDVFFVPDITITPYPDTTIYLGNSVMLVATGASTYSWSPPLY